MSAALHAPGVFVAVFQPISASRSAAVSGTFSGQRPVPPLDDVLPPDDEVLPPDEDVLPPEDDVLPPDEVLPPEDDPPEDDPPDDDPPEDDPPDDDEVFPPDDEDDVLPLEDPPLDDVVGSVPSGSVIECVTVSAVHAKVSAAADAATKAAKRCEFIAGLLQVKNQPTKPA
jgi:hypothetical protein